MDELQAFRMMLAWPAVVGCSAFLLARAIFWLLASDLTRDHAIACIIVGISGTLVALSISVAWDDSTGYWVAFTAGMVMLAVILLLTVAQLAVEMWRR